MKTFEGGMAPVFSPRSNLDALKWYGTLAGSAQDALFMTFAFAKALQARRRPAAVGISSLAGTTTSEHP
jgi:hypothetical protein